MLRTVPLGDQAALSYLPDEPTALRFAQAVRAANWPWLVDVVTAYCSVAVFHDPAAIRLAEVIEQLRRLDLAALAQELPPVGRLVQIPCCYELQHDLARVAQHTGLMPERIIELHTSCEYVVYAIGFIPGFPYMGYLPDELAHVPRLPSPRTRVEAGSVGLTGRQTGIYPLPRPGGWNLIGRTPLTLVDVEQGYFPLQVGDRVRFYRIDEAEFARLRGERL